MNTCPQCEATIARGVTDQKRVVGATTFVVRAPSFTCRRCKALFMSGETLQRVDLTVAAHLANHGAPDGDTLRFMRKALGLRALALAQLLDVTGETISRWETGQRPLDPNVWVLVGSVVLEQLGEASTTLHRLTRLRRATGRLPKTVRLDVTERPARRSSSATAPSSGPRVTRVS